MITVCGQNKSIRVDTIIIINYKEVSMYSDELQKQTKEYFKSMPIAMMKQFGTHKFGACQLESDGIYYITVFDSDEVLSFETMDELLVAGWAID